MRYRLAEGALASNTMNWKAMRSKAVVSSAMFCTVSSALQCNVRRRCNTVLQCFDVDAVLYFPVQCLVLRDIDAMLYRGSSAMHCSVST